MKLTSRQMIHRQAPKPHRQAKTLRQLAIRHRQMDLPQLKIAHRREGSAATDDDTEREDSSPSDSGSEPDESDPDGDGDQQAGGPRVAREAYTAMTNAQLVAELIYRTVPTNMPKKKDAYVDALSAADTAGIFGDGALPTVDRRRQGNR
jgi:ABC-type Zn2+ transport system substrate-binding protein/surface adhesin